jgi:di/tricarboxylate transporter
LCGIQRGDIFSAILPRSYTVIETNDILTYIGYIDQEKSTKTNLEGLGFKIISEDDLPNHTKPNIGTGLVPKYMSVIKHKKCGDIGFKTKYNFILIGIFRDDKMITVDLGDQIILPNDFIVVHGLFNRNDMEHKLSKICTKVVSHSGVDNDINNNSIHTDILLSLTFITIIISGFVNNLDVTLISIIYVTLFYLLQSVSNDDIKISLGKYKNILFGTSCSLLLTSCLSHTGVLLKFSSITQYFNGFHRWVLYFVFHIISSILSILVSNVAVVSIVIPIIKLSYLDTSELLPIAICVIHGASCCFASPTGYHTNLMVHSIGNYKCRDYLKLGLPLHLITSLVFSSCVYFFY